MAEHNHNEKDKDKGWVDRPGFIRAFNWGLYLACAGAAAGGFYWKKDHPHFEIEGFPVFFALYGFAMFMGIVLIGQHLRKLVGRKEDYYEERE